MSTQENTDGQHIEWFHRWFDSPYYHMLYRHRDDAEARAFLDQLEKRIDLTVHDSILDLACGKGRHSVYLNSKGYDVTGIDLSSESIQHAKQFENESLHFEVNDMRSFELNKQFDCILNLFTSFGYFKMTSENHAVMQRIKMHLKPGGVFVLDYFNATAICGKMAPFHVDSCSGVQFDIKKRIQDGQIIKEIYVTDGQRKEFFEERVQLLVFEDMIQMLNQVGLQFMDVYGDYELRPYQQERSDRMIIIARN